ncbi:GtrA family protein [Enterococcus sp. 2201sp1_2201st1_C11_2201SCRN_220225]|uniref:GtrA family protein n=2 Tax=unclassified Enterococcus TaxID=2608891 RepID=UPI0034A4BCD4
MFKKIQGFLIAKNLWEVFTYLFFGGLTTLVNLVVFFFTRRILNWDLVVANSLAWFLSVLFAFVTNKRWVFASKTSGASAYLIELGKFFFYRILSYLLDMGVVLLLVQGFHSGDLLAKIISQVMVVIANYLFSKWLIFTGDKKE